MVTLVMPKKESKADGRTERYLGITEAELRTEAGRLAALSKVLLDNAEAMKKLKKTHLKVDGRKRLTESVEKIKAFAQDVRAEMARGELTI